MGAQRAQPTDSSSAGTGRQGAGRVLRGITCSIAGGTLWGFSGSCAQFLLSGYAISPAQITAARMLGAGLVIVAYHLIRHRDTLRSLMGSRANILRVIVFGIFGLYLSQITYTIVIRYTNAGTATVLQCTGAVFVMLATCLLMRRLPRAAEIIGLLLASGATWLIATHGDPSHITLPAAGLAWGIANGLSVAFYIMYPVRLLRRYGTLAVLGCGMLVGSTVAVGVACTQGVFPALDTAGVAALAAIILLGTCGAYGLYLQGIKDAGAVRASMLGVSEPISACIISWLWLDTSFAPADIVGFAMMITMVLIISRMDGKAAHGRTTNRKTEGA